ncbi:uncharacterized protein LOC125244907 isoform X2 [Megalobrama amblycephala]|uniref:uncharacterized protein LOC125244907 isoform X2 n=1 Tax=Megalobrama amblycephala TaxID=75352 RepID=UPI00201400B9|nr:uncharacterized protein LOC125244907 isoform X2 [Megalobrama amblycephala]
MFSDESKFCLSFGNQGPRVWRKRGEAHNPRCLKSIVKFPQSVMVLGFSFDPPFKTSTPIKRPRMENSTDEINTTWSGTTKESATLESTYEPDITQEDSHKVCQPLYSAAKYMVYEDNLLDLFRKCPACMHTCTVNKFVIGTFVSITQICSQCVHKTQWNSQPYIKNVPAGNLHLSAAVAFTGASYIQVHKVLSALRLECMCPRTFFNHQKAFLVPTILWHWRSEQKTLVEQAKLSGKAIVLGGDMRADSPATFT